MTCAPMPCSIGVRHFPTAPNPTRPTVRPPSSPRLSTSSASSVHPLPRSRLPVELAQPPKRGKHQQQRQLGNGARVRPRHVAHGDAAGARRLEVDGVDAHAELLNQAQTRRLLDRGRRHALEDMKQNIGVVNFPCERLLVGFVDDGDAKPLVLDRRDGRAETRAWRDIGGRPSSVMFLYRRSKDQEIRSVFQRDFS